jgi:hypothetical protein
MAPYIHFKAIHRNIFSHGESKSPLDVFVNVASLNEAVELQRKKSVMSSQIERTIKKRDEISARKKWPKRGRDLSSKEVARAKISARKMWQVTRLFSCPLSSRRLVFPSSPLKLVVPGQPMFQDTFRQREPSTRTSNPST